MQPQVCSGNYVEIRMLFSLFAKFLSLSLSHIFEFVAENAKKRGVQSTLTALATFYSLSFGSKSLQHASDIGLKV